MGNYLFHSNRLPIYLNSVHHEFWSNSIKLSIFLLYFFSALIILKSRQQSRSNRFTRSFFFFKCMSQSLAIEQFCLFFILLPIDFLQKPAAIEEPANWKSFSLVVERGRILNFLYSVFQSVSTSMACMMSTLWCSLWLEFSYWNCFSLFCILERISIVAKNE